MKSENPSMGTQFGYHCTKQLSGLLYDIFWLTFAVTVPSLGIIHYTLKAKSIN